MARSMVMQLLTIQMAVFIKEHGSITKLVVRELLPLQMEINI